MELPEPLEVPWTMKPLASAGPSSARSTTADSTFQSATMCSRVDSRDGRFWFQNIEGDMELEGRRVPRYRVWHPRDHVSFRLVRRGGAQVGPGAVFHIRECFGRDPRFALDAKLHVIGSTTAASPRSPSSSAFPPRA